MNLLDGSCEQCGAEQWHEILNGKCLCEACATDVRNRRALAIAFALAGLIWIGFMVVIIMWALSERPLYFK